MNAIFTVAAKEFRDGLRNRWALAITGVFAVLALGLAYFGAAASGRVGFTGLDTTIASLASLAVFLIPLIALLLAYDGIVGEDEQGTLLLLLTYPLSRLQLLAGKALGHGALLAASTALGFGAAGLAIGLLSDKASGLALARAFGLFVLSATLLGWSFIGMAYAISAGCAEKSRAAGLALLVWFGFVLVFDLGLLGLLVGASGKPGAEWLPWLLLANPADVFRLLNLAGPGTGGVASIGTGFPPWLLLAALLAWVAAPFALAAWRFSVRER